MIIQCIQAAVAKLYTPAPELKLNNRPDCIQSGRIRPLMLRWRIQNKLPDVRKPPNRTVLLGLIFRQHL